ncbi:hypothetical protein V2J09_014620 [Rumex salicifolius]
MARSPSPPNPFSILSHSFKSIAPRKSLNTQTRKGEFSVSVIQKISLIRWESPIRRPNPVVSPSVFGGNSVSALGVGEGPLVYSKEVSFQSTVTVSRALNLIRQAQTTMAARSSPPPSKRRRRVTNDDQNSSPEPEMSILEKLSPVVVFAHGAGAPSTSDWMIRWKEMLGNALHAVEVVTFDYPYMAAGKKVAPKAETLVDFHTDIVKKAVAKHPGHPLILVGKSMGSRVSCMVSARDDINASAIVCLGYPLKGMKGAIRDEILVQLGVPILFVQGSKDGLCPLDKLKSVQKKVKPLNDLYVVEGGDHSLKVGKKHLLAQESTQEDAEGSALVAIAQFVAKSLSED